MSVKNNQYKLFIDESGTASLKDKGSVLYILAGCSIEEGDRNEVKIKADQIKYKYWGRTDIIFHSREIGRRQNNFKIFKDKKLYDNFLKDIKGFLLDAKFKMFFIILDKKKLRKLSWNQVKIYKETSKLMIHNFLLALLAIDSRGKIIVESATSEKDFHFHRALGIFLSEGIKNPKIDFSLVQEKITSISFVSKKNHDIEEQIADLLAYGAKCKYLKNKLNRKYESLVVNILERKIFKIPKNANVGKMQYLKEINPFYVIPQ